MAQRQNMRVHVKPPKIEWRTIAITDIDPAHFAQSLQTALQELSDTGFNILAQLTRGSAHVILASRVVLEPSAESMMETVPPPPSLAPPRRLSARRPVREPLTSPDVEQFVYHYLSPSGPQSVQCASMAEALRLVKSHILGERDFVPGYLVCMVTTTFEPPSFPMLLQTYADEIAALPVRQAD